MFTLHVEHIPFGHEAGLTYIAKTINLRKAKPPRRKIGKEEQNK